MSEFDPRFDPAFQRGYDAQGPAESSVRSTGPETASSAPMISVGEPPEEAEPAKHRPNPFLIALLALSVGMIAVGGALTMRLGDVFNSTQFNSEVDYVKLQIVMIGTPILIGLGLATLVGVLFMYAVRWGR